MYHKGIIIKNNIFSTCSFQDLLQRLSHRFRSSLESVFGAAGSFWESGRKCNTDEKLPKNPQNFLRNFPKIISKFLLFF